MEPKPQDLLELRFQVATKWFYTINKGCRSVTPPKGGVIGGFKGRKDCESFIRDTCPHYESKIEPAFDVVDAVCNARNGTLVFTLTILDPASGDAADITASFIVPFLGDSEFFGQGENIQEAICNAAMAVNKETI